MANLTRRGFLGSLLGLVASAQLDPEKLLWVPGAKTIFIPPVSRGHILTIQEIAWEYLKILERNLEIYPLIYRAKVGDTISVRRPPRFTPSDEYKQLFLEVIDKYTLVPDK